MPTLNWIGKDKVVSLHNDVPFHVLEHGYGFTADGGKTEVETGSGNKIIHGDNLTALKSLLPEYEGRIDCIYIDPPYNTGNENWVYNDNVNDPHFKRWLGEVVGKEGEDLSRHDKWCCMMYPRLRLLKQLLSEHGVIFISIDDNEYATLHGLCDEILGESNYIATIVWQKRTSPDARRILSAGHEYILIYTKRLDETFNGIHKLSWNEESAKNYKNPDNDPRGPWISTDCTAQAGHGTKNQFYKMITPAGRVIELPDNLCWRFTKQRMDEEIAAGRIWFGVDGRGVPRKKTYLSESEGHNVWTWWPNTEVGHTQEATKELTNILEATAKFDYPKPVRLIKRALEIATNKDSIILDSFAGSGTTAHAVLDLNKKDGGNRKFILIEMMDYADTITAERVKRVMTGYPYKGEKKEEIYSKKLTPKNITQGDKLLAEAQAKADEEAKNYTKVSKPKIQDNCLKVIGTTDEKMPGLGGAFDYYELGPSLFDKDGFLNEDVGEDAIREYVYYSETRQHLTRQRQESSKYLLDTFGGTAYYFYYEPHCMTSLDFKSPLHIAEKADQYIIYADVCYLPDDYMRKYHIIFKKIPRDIRQF